MPIRFMTSVGYVVVNHIWIAIPHCVLHHFLMKSAVCTRTSDRPSILLLFWGQRGAITHLLKDKGVREYAGAAHRRAETIFDTTRVSFTIVNQLGC